MSSEKKTGRPGQTRPLAKKKEKGKKRTKYLVSRGGEELRRKQRKILGEGKHLANRGKEKQRRKIFFPQRRRKMEKEKEDNI